MPGTPLSEKEKQARKNLIRKWSKSGLSTAQWCREQNMSYGQFIYWKGQFSRNNQKLSPSGVMQTDFVEIADSPSHTSGVSIHFQNLSIRLDRDFDKETLRRCLEILEK
jgi:hypothetical protein